MSFRKILLLPHLKIHNANALSSPFTVGFPAMTAWLGATHALQRLLCAQGIDISCKATGVASHQFDLQTYRGANDFVSSVVGTGNPLDKTGQRSSFIEEPRCHLDVSVFIEIEGITQEQEESVVDAVSHLLNAKMKMAGGDIQSFAPPIISVLESESKADLQRFSRKLMPGYVLIERRDLMVEAMEGGQDAMEALLDYLVIHHRCEQSEEGEVSWSRRRKAQQDKPAGWIVPIATGFHGVSELCEAKNQRDAESPHRFSESLVTLGEFKMPHRFNVIDDMLWEYHVDPAHNLYQCLPASVSISTSDDEYI